MNMTEELCGKVISGHEKYNVDVLSGQKKFIKYFQELINDKKIKKNHNKDPDAFTHPDFEINEDVELDENVKKDGKLTFLSVKTEKGKQESISQAVIDNIDLTIEPETPPKFYYYRRWLWMIFPWVCMSVQKKQTYSELINKCYSSNIRYLSVDEERMFTKHAIKIVIETKQKRKQMYAKKEDDGSQLPTSMQTLQKTNRNLSPLTSTIKSKLKQNASQVTTLPEEQSTLNNESSVVLRPLKISNSRLGSRTNLPHPKKSALYVTDISDSRVGSAMMLSVSHKNLRSVAQSTSFGSGAGQGRGNAVIDTVLRKSEFWEDLLKSKGYRNDVKQILIENNESAEAGVPKLKDIFGAYTGKELRLLERKNAELTKEFNRLFDESRNKKKVLDALYMREFAMTGPNPNVEIGMKQELSDSIAKMSGIEKQKVKSIEKKIRHERIIDICELNSIQNEQWIRGLNFYLSNMRKMIKKEKSEISVLEKDIETLTGMNEDFVRSHNSNVDSHSLVIQSIKSHLDRQVRIDAQIGNTNTLIFKSIEIKRNKHYESLAKDREREELEARQIFEQKKRKHVEHELALVSKKFEQVKDIFEKCPTTNVDWEQKTEFTVMLSNLETLRDLERYSVELDIKGADLRESNAKLRLRLAVNPIYLTQNRLWKASKSKEQKSAVPGGTSLQTHRQKQRQIPPKL
jgi:hypothetical protein